MFNYGLFLIRNVASFAESYKKRKDILTELNKKIRWAFRNFSREFFGGIEENSQAKLIPLNMYSRIVQVRGSTCDWHEVALRRRHRGDPQGDGAWEL